MMLIEVVVLPVADVDRAAHFYAEQMEFHLDADFRPTDDLRIVQLTPVGSACSIQVGVGLTDAAPGSVRNTFMMVPDIVATQARLRDRGVVVGELRHKTPIGAWDGGYAPGVDPARGDYASFADFADPDGNTWVLQERGYHPG